MLATKVSILNIMVNIKLENALYAISLNSALTLSESVTFSEYVNGLTFTYVLPICTLVK